VIIFLIGWCLRRLTRCVVCFSVHGVDCKYCCNLFSLNFFFYEKNGGVPTVPALGIGGGGKSQDMPQVTYREGSLLNLCLQGAKFMSNAGFELPPCSNQAQLEGLSTIPSITLSMPGATFSFISIILSHFGLICLFLC